MTDEELEKRFKGISWALNYAGHQIGSLIGTLRSMGISKATFYKFEKDAKAFADAEGKKSGRAAEDH